MTNREDYRNYAVRGLLPSEVQWALSHDAVHGIAFAFENPVAVTDTTEDLDDGRKTYLIRADPKDVANAIVEINEWIIDQDRNSPDALDAIGFVRALSREGLLENVEGDDYTGS
jgi:hypothetical protein